MVSTAEFDGDLRGKESLSSNALVPRDAGLTSEDPWVVRRLRVGVFGEFSAGKSTLINKLVEEELFSVSLQPETDCIQIVTHPGPTTRSRCSADSTNEPKVIERKGKLFKLGLELWDTPGFNAEDPLHEQIAQQAIEEVDLAVYLIRARDGVTRSSKEAYSQLKDALQAQGRSAPQVILTRFDELIEDIGDEEDSLEEIQEVLKDCSEQLGSTELPWGINCKEVTSLDGPKLLDWLEVNVTNYARKHLGIELGNPTHGLRKAIALENNWRDLLHDSLNTETINVILEACESECTAASKVRDHNKLSAYYEYVPFNAKRSWRRFLETLMSTKERAISFYATGPFV